MRKHYFLQNRVLKMKILIVDQSSNTREKLNDLLDNEGYEVYLAQNVTDALRTLKMVKDISVVLSDLTMPEMDAMTFIKIVRKSSKNKDLPILIQFCANEWIKELKESGKDLGVTAWIPKPLKKDALLGAVEKVIGRLTNNYARKTA